jgi:hypothetical protein
VRPRGPSQQGLAGGRAGAGGRFRGPAGRPGSGARATAPRAPSLSCPQRFPPTNPSCHQTPPLSRTVVLAVLSGVHARGKRGDGGGSDGSDGSHGSGSSDGESSDGGGGDGAAAARAQRRGAQRAAVAARRLGGEDRGAAPRVRLDTVRVYAAGQASRRPMAGPTCRVRPGPLAFPDLRLPSPAPPCPRSLPLHCSSRAARRRPFCGGRAASRATTARAAASAPRACARGCWTARAALTWRCTAARCRAAARAPTQARRAAAAGRAAARPWSRP